MSCVTRTQCSWVSSLKASKRSVSESTGSSRSGEGLEGAAACGSWVVVEVGGMRTGQCFPGDRPGNHTEPETHKAHPRPRAHDQSHMTPQVAGHQVCPT